MKISVIALTIVRQNSPDVSVSIACSPGYAFVCTGLENVREAVKKKIVSTFRDIQASDINVEVRVKVER